MQNNPNIVIAGAGTIGCFVGGLLHHAGSKVSFLGRERLADTLSQNGLRLTDWQGLDVSIDAKYLDFHQTPVVLKNADIILVCVKSAATETIAQLIKKHANKNAIVVSFQNGVKNANRLRTILPKHDVRGAMVAYNVIEQADGHFHRGTSGKIIVENGPTNIAERLNTKDLTVVETDKIDKIQWGKLLLNLNNGLNALADMPLREQLQIWTWRRRFAMQISEALAVLKAEKLNPVPPSPVPASLIPLILSLPTPLFKLIAKPMLAIDPKARSSMWDDVKAGRPTEIDEFQGEIIRLGKKHGIATPECEKVLSQVKALNGN